MSDSPSRFYRPDPEMPSAEIRSEYCCSDCGQEHEYCECDLCPECGGCDCVCTDDDGQPSEYDEWQDFYGGDDWDQGQFDDY